MELPKPGAEAVRLQLSGCRVRAGLRLDGGDGKD
jgi:hypothetical protein